MKQACGIVKRQGGEETESGTATKKNPRSKPISMTFPGQLLSGIRSKQGRVEIDLDLVSGEL